MAHQYALADKFPVFLVVRKYTVIQQCRNPEIVFKGVQMGHVTSTLIPKNLSQMRLTQDMWQSARQSQSTLTLSQSISGLLMHHRYRSVPETILPEHSFSLLWHIFENISVYFESFKQTFLLEGHFTLWSLHSVYCRSLGLFRPILLFILTY